MVKLDMYTTILTLHKQGHSQRSISRITNKNRRTIQKIIRKYQLNNIESPIPYVRSSKLDMWHDRIIELLSNNLSVVRIFEELKLLGCSASYSLVNRYVKRYELKQTTCIRFHTAAGEEAQVDFGDIGKQYDKQGRFRKAYVFNMRLSYSRLDYYEVVFDQKIATWIKCHINAFNYFGGVPKVIKLDNLKSGVINANFYEPIYQKEYKRLADHYGTLLSPCRPYQPQEKGKVESGIKYVKHNFFAGRSFTNHHDMVTSLDKWTVGANDRIHGTTKLKPRELFDSEELSSMNRLPLLEFDMSSQHIRIVAKDCHITLENNYYSVPSKYVKSEVLASISNNLVKIYVSDNLIATRARAQGKGIFTTNLSHYATNKSYCPGFKQYDDKYQNEMRAIGKSASSMLTIIMKEHKDWHRAVRGIIKLTKTYDAEIVDKACARALSYGICSYSKIKSIIENNCYNLPLPNFRGDYAKIA